jgi:hypothetical protein
MFGNMFFCQFQGTQYRVRSITEVNGVTKFLLDPCVKGGKFQWVLMGECESL